MSLPPKRYFAFVALAAAEFFTFFGFFVSFFGDLSPMADSFHDEREIRPAFGPRRCISYCTPAAAFCQQVRAVFRKRFLLE
jgi:hypothetical protein